MPLADANCTNCTQDNRRARPVRESIPNRRQVRARNYGRRVKLRQPTRITKGIRTTCELSRPTLHWRLAVKGTANPCEPPSEREAALVEEARSPSWALAEQATARKESHWRALDK